MGGKIYVLMKCTYTHACINVFIRPLVNESMHACMHLGIHVCPKLE